ncbi:hypothetical protein HDV06_001872 [Boothiomyces sp. JEL0866]|nr:hypothetical protein HDV06_001872 [Boothiomyces sp. JEL0866]
MDDQQIITHDAGVIVKKSSFMTEISKFKSVSGTRNKKFDSSNHENPRPYQTELFVKAKESNILAILDTGSGKTMIALLLLRHMASLEPESGPKKCSIFLVPTIPLVSQQANYIEENSPLKVKQFHGGTTSSLWDKQYWANEIQEYDVLVITPAIFLYTLDKAHIRLTQINLLVFDECHHARASHPYNLIMKLHYKTTLKESRPKIFGMTASPCVAKESTADAIRQLEANLNANAISADNYSQLANYVTRPMERIVYYGEGDFFEPPKLYLKLNERYQDLMVLLQREIADCIAFSDTLGPWAADRALEFAIVDLTYSLQRQITIKKRQVTEAKMPAAEEVDVDVSNQDTIKNDENNVELQKLEEGEIMDDQGDSDLNFQTFGQEMSMLENLSIEHLELYHNYCIELAQDEKWGVNADPPRDDQIGGKVVKLVELLLEYKDEPEYFCGIVFCQQRVMARVLQLLIQHHPKLDFVRSSYLLGHGGGRSNLYKRSSSMSVTVQKDIVNLKLTEDGMRSALKPEIRTEELAKFDETQDEAIFKIPNTGASITLYNSLQLLYQYCAILPRDKYYDPQPMFLFAEGANGFICEVRMPISIRKDCSRLRGAICNSRKDAKRDVCFRMIKLLHSVGELNDYLQPMKVTEIDETTGLAKHNTEKRRIGPKRKIRSFEAGIASFFQGVWTSTQIFYLNLVHMAVKDSPDVRTLAVGFLSFRPLSEDCLDFSMKVNSNDNDFKVYTLEEPVTLSQSQITDFQKYHYQYFKTVLRSEFEETEEWGPLCVPLKSEVLSNNLYTEEPINLVDWKAIEYFKLIVSESHFINVAEDTEFDDIKDIVIYDRYRYKRHYILTDIRNDLTPMSNVQLDQNGKEGTILNIYKQNFGCQEEIDPNQVLLMAKPLGYPYQSKKRSPKFYEVHLIPQFAAVSPIKTTHIKEALYYPLFFRYLNHRLMMYDLMHGTPVASTNLLLTTSIDLLQKAFTCPSANLSYNYERLEFLGDSFLKVHLTLHLFVLNPNRHEGYLSQARVQLENNNNLRSTANSHKLETYILSFPFSRQHWIPPRQKGNMNQLLSDKTVADVFEATIGACFVDSGVSSAAACIKSFLGDAFYGNWSGYKLKWSSYGASSMKFDPSMIKSCKAVEQKIGYKFKNISLLAEALTHSSAIVGQASYERLEFLGDSILGFVVTDFLVNLDLKMQPGALSDLRTELVNNQFLGVVACALELSKYMNYLNVELSSAITYWCNLFEEELEMHENVQKIGQSSDSILFWNRLPSSPKTLGDLYESLLGAVFVDSGFDYQVVQGIVIRTIFDRWWYRFELLLEDSTGLQAKHPLRQLQELIVSLKCGKLFMELSNLSDGTSECEFKLHNIQIAVSIAESKKDAKKNAAYIAVNYINEHMGADGKLDVCDCAVDLEEEKLRREIAEELIYVEMWDKVEGENTNDNELEAEVLRQLSGVTLDYSL